MIKPSLKTKERLAKRLTRHGIAFDVVYGEPYFMEPVTLKIGTKMGVTFIVKSVLPICPFPEHGHYTLPVGGKVSRMAKAYHLKKMEEDALRPNREQEKRAIEASEELVDFLHHIKNPRFSVKR